MTKAHLIIISFAFILLLTSCETILYGLISPDRCKGCKVVNQRTGEIVWQEQGCGGAKANIEDNAKIEAYEYNIEKSAICVYKVECETWEEEEENVEDDED